MEKDAVKGNKRKISNKLIRDFLKILDTIENTKNPLLTPEDEKIIIKGLKNGITADDSIRERLIVCLIKTYDKAFKAVANDFYAHRSKHFNKKDLHDISMESVLFFVSKYDPDNAAKKKRANASEFNPDKGTLEQYLKCQIKAELNDNVNKDEGRSSYDKRSTKKLEDFKNTFFLTHGRYPKENEIIEGTGFSKEKYASVSTVNKRQDIYYMDAHLEEESYNKVDTDETLWVRSTEDMYLDKEKQDIILCSLNKLKGKGIFYDIGIDVLNDVGIKEVANKYGISEYNAKETITLIKEYFKEILNDYENDLQLEFMTFKLKKPIEL